jgi:hypothetical protein
MSEKILRALQFLRITDESGNLSLTNIALVSTLVVVLRRPELQVGDIATFIATVAGYQVKRFLSGGAAPSTEAEDLKAAVESLQTKVTSLQMANQNLRR